MLNFVVVFNCHGAQYVEQLRQSPQFNNTYKCDYIHIYDYLPGGVLCGKLNFVQEDMDKLTSADAVLIQHIKTDRGFLNHTNILKLVKNNCIVIKIPHYTFSGYHMDYDFRSDTNLINMIGCTEKLKHYIQHIPFDSDLVHAHTENELENIRNLDKLSDIQMYDIVRDNYTTHKLFYCRSYPTYMFFFFASNQILKLLHIDDGIYNPRFTGYAHHLEFPIFPRVKDILELKFDNSENIVPYILTCIKLNKDCLVLQNRKSGRIDLQTYNSIKQELNTQYKCR